MELETIKKLIKKYEPGHTAFMNEAMIGERYYDNKTDVLLQDEKKDKDDNPLRNADNRIPRNFHGLIVNQKASYAFTAPPLFDVGKKEANKAITECLGDEYAKNCMELCVNAANTSIGWVHYWEDETDGFQWAVVDSKQIIPVWSKNLKKKLLGVLRVYEEIDEDDGETYTIYQYWTDTECQAFRKLSGGTFESFSIYNMFFDPDSGEEVASYKHNFERVPFIPFRNNNTGKSDLVNIKKLIDVYDKVYSGFINDLEDIQELIFVLSGYGGESLNGFLQELKKYKTIKVDGNEDNHPGVNTLSIEIPIEARKTVLECTRKAIFEQGQGFDPQPEEFGNQSGEALKFMYSLLEMKVGFMETQFRIGFGELVRAICRYNGIECKTIIQTWTRTCIKNDKELADICKSSVGIVSKRTILKNHPLVEDVEQELKSLEEEEAETEKKLDPYNESFPLEKDNKDGAVDGKQQ